MQILTNKNVYTHITHAHTGRRCPHCGGGLVDVLLDWEDELRDYEQAVDLSNRYLKKRHLSSVRLGSIQGLSLYAMSMSSGFHLLLCWCPQTSRYGFRLRKRPPNIFPVQSIDIGAKKNNIFGSLK